ncbi:MAG: sodium:calcium antiporter [Alphaproteobacteria bacterium]|nr:MAG: sodium:calcium antiporter [Alphaproteobacteria bacterium]
MADQIIELLGPTGLETFQSIGLGVILLALGGDVLVRGALGCAHRLKLSTLFVGIAIVSLGTSAPEFGIAVIAVYYDQLDIAVGTAIGSNIANIFLIMGLAALIRPLLIRNTAIVRDGVFFIAASGFLLWIAQTGFLTIVDAGFFLGALVLYIFTSYVTELFYSPAKTSGTSPDQAGTVSRALDIGLAGRSLVLSLIFVIAGGVTLYFGAQFVIEGTIGYARQSGIEEGLLSLSVVALGAALPELVATVFACLRNQPSLVIGNLIGSSIINILGVLGLTAFLADFDIEIASIFTWDIWIMFAAALILLPFMVTGRLLSRFEGMLLVVAYGSYLYMLFTIHPAF